MVIFIRKVIAVPIRLFAEVVGSIKIFDSTQLWFAIWKLSGSMEDGCKLLTLMCREGVSEQARSRAKQMIAETKYCTAAAVMGQLEIRHGGDLDAARGWVELAKCSECKNPEVLLCLELLISAREGCESEAVMDAILRRNDLPVIYTRMALFSKAWKLAERRRWSEAEAIADKILCIEEQVDARFIKWISCSVRGEQEAADRHLSAAKGQTSEEWFNALVAQGWLFMGDRQKAMKWLYKAERAGVRLEESRSPLGALAHSEQFGYFCRSKECR